eukprot:TRINITY_DN114349_c0_g1_i1.p1 TRINITY_DN114349_c0_g1~~TRINITY_DN114349_c0_g1_i1.p1  ORF type:complete len:347 (+),score=73.60 TRINITY_DN114349_c0_g1_i1:29-1042(+)
MPKTEKKDKKEKKRAKSKDPEIVAAAAAELAATELAAREAAEQQAARESAQQLAADRAPVQEAVLYQDDAPPLHAPALKVPLPSFPMEQGTSNDTYSYGQAWPEHLNRKDPFAMWRRGASRYYQPAAFDPFEEWRRPGAPSVPARYPGLEEGREQPVPFSAVTVSAQPDGFDRSLPEACQRCGNIYMADANFCRQCGLMRQRPQDGGRYCHPEKLLPGPPLRHEAQLELSLTAPGPAEEQPFGAGGDVSQAIPPAQTPPTEEDQGFAGALLSWIRPVTQTLVPSQTSAPPSPSTVAPLQASVGRAPPRPSTLAPPASGGAKQNLCPPPSGTLRPVCR